MKRNPCNKSMSVALTAALAAAMVPMATVASGCANSENGANSQTEQSDASNASNTAATNDQQQSNSTAQQAEGQNNSQRQDGNPPEKPDGDSEQAPSNDDGNGDSNDGGTPPEKPEGDSGQAPDGQAPNGDAPNGDQSGGANTQTFDYSGSYTATLNADGETKESAGEAVSSTDADNNAVAAQNGANLSVNNAKITKSGSDTNGDNCNFYGLNSSVLAVGENTLLKLSGSTITSTSEGSNAVFATDNATVYANDCNILTATGGNSRGLDVTYGATIIANAMTVSTEGEHCAAVASDRGGGSISVSNSQLSTQGAGSPLVYSTGDLELDNVTGTASGSQICGMEGENVIKLNGCTLESTSDAISSSDPIKNGVILYQSTSGDADTSASEQADFEASDSTLKTSISDGAMFYVTNTTANIALSNTTLDFNSDNVELLRAAGNNSSAGWGTSGKNAGNATLTAVSQSMSGNVYVDSISTACIYLTQNSSWTGSVSGKNTLDDGTKATPKNATINVDGTSTWTVSADCYVGNLNVESGGKVVDSNGKTATIVNAKGKTLLKGTGSVTVTVKGSYSSSVDTSNAGSIQGANDALKTARCSFDSVYGTSTTWGENAGTATGSSITAVDASKVAASTSDTESESANKGPGANGGPGQGEQASTSSGNAVLDWFNGIINAIKGLFGA